MSSPADPSFSRDIGPGAWVAADVGLLSPVSAGTTVEGLSGDQALVDALVGVEAALVRALVDAEVAPPEAAAAADAIERTEVDPRELALAAVPGGTPVIALVRQLRAVARKTGVRWVHHGATSQDIVDTALMVVSTRALDRILTDLTGLAATLAHLADEHRDVPVVARTLTQQAMPTTLGFRTATWLAGVHDSVRAVRSCLPLPASLAGPVGTASAFGARGPAVVEAFAGRLGLRAPTIAWHTRRLPVAGLAAALVGVTGACGKIATDVLVLSQTEVGEVREGRGGTSSSMPHKRNPTQSILVASASRQAPALVSVIGAATAAEQERPAGAWHAEWQPLRLLLRLAGGAAERTASLVAELQLDEEAMAGNLARLVVTLDEADEWVEEQTGHVSVWVDRVLADHKELFP